MKPIKLERGMKIPTNMLMATDEEINNKLLNNCGPGGPLNSVIPDSLLGADISTACNIHDWTYLEAKNERDHRRSDYLFLENIKTKIRSNKAGPLLKYMRYGLAYIYYGAVRMYSLTKSFLLQNSNKNRRNTL